MNQADIAVFFAWLPLIGLAWLWLGSVILTPIVAASKGQISEWFFAGLLFGPLGLLAVAGLPDRKKPLRG